MSLIVNFADASSVASTSSLGTDLYPSSNGSSSISVPPVVSSPSRVSALSRKRRAANVLPTIGLGVSESSSAASENSPAGGPDADDGTKRIRFTQDSDSRPFGQVAQVECSQGSTSSSSSPSYKKIEHHVEGYEILPVGKELTAVHCETKAIMQATMLSDKDALHFERIATRLSEAEQFSNRSRANIKKMREMILPKGCEFRKSESNGRFYVFSPMYHGTLHGLVMQRKDLTNIEEQMQPLYLQIVELVDFCHEIGILMRDLRLRKFVFIDEKLTKLRLGSVLDVSICEDPQNDLLSDRQGCPAYVAPEILCTEDYAGRPADVWALGILIFVLLTGRYPFYDATPPKLFNKIRVARFAIPAKAKHTLTPSAKALFHVLLRRNPIERPTVHDLLAESWVKGDRASVPDRLSERPAVSSAFSAISTFSQVMNAVSHAAAAVGSRGLLPHEILRYRRHQEDQSVPEVQSDINRTRERLNSLREFLNAVGMRSVVPNSRSNSPVAPTPARSPRNS